MYYVHLQPCHEIKLFITHKVHRPYMFWEILVIFTYDSYHMIRLLNVLHKTFYYKIMNALKRIKAFLHVFVGTPRLFLVTYNINIKISYFNPTQVPEQRR